MTLPALALLAVFGYMPMFGMVMAFQSYDLYDGFLHSPWVGLDNFQQLFADPGFWHAFEQHAGAQSRCSWCCSSRSRSRWPSCWTPCSSRKVRSFIQAVVYLPHFFSWVLVITIFQQMLGGAGLLNTFLRQHGIANPATS